MSDSNDVSRLPSWQGTGLHLNLELDFCVHRDMAPEELPYFLGGATYSPLREAIVYHRPEQTEILHPA